MKHFVRDYGGQRLPAVTVLGHGSMPLLCQVHLPAGGGPVARSAPAALAAPPRHAPPGSPGAGFVGSGPGSGSATPAARSPQRPAPGSAARAARGGGGSGGERGGPGSGLGLAKPQRHVGDPPPEPVLVPPRATAAQLRRAAQKAFRRLYHMLEDFVVCHPPARNHALSTNATLMGLSQNKVFAVCLPCATFKSGCVMTGQGKRSCPSRTVCGAGAPWAWEGYLVFILHACASYMWNTAYGPLTKESAHRRAECVGCPGVQAARLGGEQVVTAEHISLRTCVSPCWQVARGGHRRWSPQSIRRSII